MRGENFRVIIIGGGIAGNTLAFLLSRENIDACVIERKKEIGKPVECAEFIPKRLFFDLKVDFGIKQDFVCKYIKRMTVFYGKKQKLYNTQGYTIDREKLEVYLKQGAKNVIYKLNSFAFCIKGKKVYIKEKEPLGSNIQQIEGDIIVGADGASSLVARVLRQKKEYILASQVKARLKTDLDEILIFFRDYIKGGYGWVFPKGNYANVGIGIDSFFKENPKKILEIFIKELISEGIIEGETHSKITALIPTSGLCKKISEGRYILVGDAGGFVEPITGAGISNAILSSVLAQESIKKSIKNKNPSLSEYQKEAYWIFGDILESGFEDRLFLRENWDLSNLMKIWDKRFN